MKNMRNMSDGDGVAVDDLSDDYGDGDYCGDKNRWQLNSRY